MRIIITLLFAFLCFCLNGQNVLNVDPAYADGLTSFSSLQEAIDAASEGDEIRVYPGGYSGTTVVDKRLSITGRGYNIFENYPTVNTSFNNARIDNLHLEPGAAGTLVEGLEIEDLKIRGATDCVIRKNRINTIVAFDVSTLTVKQNLIVGNQTKRYSDIDLPGCLESGSSTNSKVLISGIGSLIFKNNIVYNAIANNYSFLAVNCGNVDAVGTADLQFNYFNRFSNIHRGAIFVANNQFNIVQGWSNLDGLGLITNNVILVTSNIPDSNRAISTFADELISGNNSIDGRYQLLPTAQSRNYATDGGDIGPFGGPNPYILSGVTALPFIYQLNVPDEAATGNGLPVNIKVRTQN